MLRKLVSQVDVDLVLWPEEPLLIAAGIPGATGIDLPCVVTYRSGSGLGQPYLPGSSLKGVLRSHAERISRSMAPRARVCDPHLRSRDGGDRDRVPSCGERLRRGKSMADIPASQLYRESCPICRTFGSTVYRGRFAIGDAYLKDGQQARTERRDGVGIDRFSGGASRGVKFEMEVVTSGEFRTHLRLENFEGWQIGVLAMLCRDLEDKFISIGHATTRGLGRLGARIERLDVSYVVPPKAKLEAEWVHGVGRLLGDEGKEYGYRPEDRFQLTEAVPLVNQSIRRQQSFPAERRRAFFDDAVACWATNMERWGAEA